MTLHLTSCVRATPTRLTASEMRRLADLMERGMMNAWAAAAVYTPDTREHAGIIEALRFAADAA